MGPRVLDVGLRRGFKFPGVRHCFLSVIYKAGNLLVYRFRGVVWSGLQFAEADIRYVVVSNGGLGVL